MLVLPQYIYIIAPHHADFVKIGKWTSSIKKLKTRYITCYGNMDIYAFQCCNDTESQVLEQEAHQFLRNHEHAYHLGYEIYKKNYLNEILSIISRKCLDYCHWVYEKHSKIHVDLAIDNIKPSWYTVKKTSQSVITASHKREKRRDKDIANCINYIFERIWLQILDDEKQKLIDAQSESQTEHVQINLIQKFLDKFVEKSDKPKAFLRQVDLWDKYSEFQVEQNIKTKLGKHKFCQLLAKILPKKSFKKDYWSGKSCKNVWLNYSWVLDPVNS